MEKKISRKDILKKSCHTVLSRQKIYRWVGQVQSGDLNTPNYSYIHSHFANKQTVRGK